MNCISISAAGATDSEARRALRTPVDLSIFTNRAQPLGKRFLYLRDGALDKRGCAFTDDGAVVEIRRITTLREFADLRVQLTGKQALAYGTCGHDQAAVVFQRNAGASGGHAEVSRDKEHFQWPAGPGIWLGDHDPQQGTAPLAADQLRAAVIEALPPLKDTELLWAPSTSSCVWDADLDIELRGLRGQRLYTVVDDASCIPALGALLFDRLALTGHGRVKITKAGTMLKDGLFDTNVWQPERLDFVRATCGQGLEQRYPEPIIWPGDRVNARRVLSDYALSDTEKQRLDAVWAELFAAAAPEAARVREAWAYERAVARLKKRGVIADEAAITAEAERLKRMADAQELDPDFEVTLHDGRVVELRDLLRDPDEYSTRGGDIRLADPLEPEYGGGDRRIAIWWTKASRTEVAAGITSHAHGGVEYTVRMSAADLDFDGLDDDDDAGVVDVPSREVPEPRPALTAPPAERPAAPTSNTPPAHIAGTDGTTVATVERAAVPANSNPKETPLQPSGRKTPASIQFVAAALRAPATCGKLIRWDAFSTCVMLADPPGAGRVPQWRAYMDVDGIKMREHLERRCNFAAIAKETMRDCIDMVAHEDPFDSAAEWLGRLNWDGVPRVAMTLPTYFGAADTPYTRAVGLYLWTALAGRVLKPGVKADMVPVAVGDQGRMKSSTIKAMVPDEARQFVEIDLASRDADVVRQMQGTLVVELGELRGLSKRDAEGVKAFLSRQVDSWVPKYRETAVQAPRRSIFFGSVNPEDSGFLTDPTGHRRWLPFDSDGACDPAAMELDRDQLWAEAAALFKAGGVQWADAERLARAEHGKYIERDVIDDAIAAWLEGDADGAEEIDGIKPAPRTHAVLGDVLRHACGVIGMAKQADQKRAAAAMRRLGWQPPKENKAAKIKGRVAKWWTRGPSPMPAAEVTG